MSNEEQISDETIEKISGLLDMDTNGLTTNTNELLKYLNIMWSQNLHVDDLDNEQHELLVTDIGDSIYDLVVPDHDSLNIDEIRNRLDLIKQNVLTKLFPYIHESHKDMGTSTLMIR